MCQEELKKQQIKSTTINGLTKKTLEDFLQFYKDYTGEDEDSDIIDTFLKAYKEYLELVG